VNYFKIFVLLDRAQGFGISGNSFNNMWRFFYMANLKKILIVDDEENIRCLLSEVLSNKGFEVNLAQDGQESVDQLGNKSFDLVITDINMPRLNGIEMLKWMKKTDRKEKIIIMTGDPTDERLRNVDIPHVEKRLLKPFKLNNLLDVVIASMVNKGELQNAGLYE